MDETFVIPDSLRVSIETPTGFIMTTAGQVLAIPSDITGTFDGEVVAPGGRQIRFSMAMAAPIAGLTRDKVGEIAAEIGRHLAANDGDWPTREAHVRQFPVIDFSLAWQVTPERTEPDPTEVQARADRLAALPEWLDPAMAAGIRQMLADRDVRL